MLTYQVRPRVFRIDDGQTLPFPSDGEVRFYFQPLQPFGLEAGGGRTAVRAVKASKLFDANTGAYTIESMSPLDRLDITIQEPKRTFRFEGNVLTISQHFESNQELTETIDGIYFAMPALLSVEFADPPYVQRVNGAVGSVGFRWELKEWKMHFRTTTQEQQESRAAVSWERIGLLSASGRRRLLAALHYFHVALRLSREGSIAGEFMPEMILNLSKVLEVLFPPDGAGRTLDAARRGLTALGFSRTEIEGDYIPAMALRNEIDVGHVVLSLFTREQLALIHGYTDHAEEAFRILIGRVFDRIEAGEFDVETYEPESAGNKAAAVVDRLREFADRYAL